MKIQRGRKKTHDIFIDFQIEHERKREGQRE